MNQQDFVTTLESALQLSSHPFGHAALSEFVADFWPSIIAHPVVAFWAKEFANIGGMEVGG